jgi:hypothetical protein
VVVLALAGAGLWAARHRAGRVPAPEPAPAPPPEDPRLTYAGPFRNVAPDVAYVGDAKCAECHQDLAASYRRHPMGRSLLPVARVAAGQRTDADTHNPFEALGTLWRVERQGDRLFHHQVGRDDNGQAVYDLATPVDYVLGSGTRGYAYLTERDGYVFQSPVSWFSQKHIWDASPGFGVGARPGRPIPARCLFCHANRVRPRPGYVNRYEEPLFEGTTIGCERCHGPGARHVQDPGRTDPGTGADLTIVNPRRLAADLRAAVCEQCHLTGEAHVPHRGRDLFDFRPGLPADAFWSVYVRAAEPGETPKAVNHVEQMVASRCFTGSRDVPAEGKRKLGCTSCHDPHRHVGPEERVAHYRARCLACHQAQDCSVPEPARRRQSPPDSCIDCHMQRYPPRDIAHTAATDHRILRRPDPLSAPRPPGQPGIVPFYRPRPGADDREAGRDLGIALVRILVQRLLQGQAPPAGAQAVALLKEAVRNDPADLPAWEALAEALTLLDRPAEAADAYEALLARDPHREAALMGAAMLAQKQRLPAAASYWRRAVAEGPWQPAYRASLAQVLAEQKAWDEAATQAEAWVRLDPANLDARVLHVSCLAHSGHKDAARAKFAKIERLRPPNLPLLQARFTVELRQR